MFSLPPVISAARAVVSRAESRSADTTRRRSSTIAAVARLRRPTSSFALDAIIGVDRSPAATASATVASSVTGALIRRSTNRLISHSVATMNARIATSAMAMSGRACRSDASTLASSTCATTRHVCAFVAATIARTDVFGPEKRTIVSPGFVGRLVRPGKALHSLRVRGRACDHAAATSQ